MRTSSTDIGRMTPAGPGLVTDDAAPDGPACSDHLGTGT